LLAVLKPDHIGDLVLASPAIRFLAGQSDGLRLFVHPGSAATAEVLFPDLERRSIELSHFAKSGGTGAFCDEMEELAACDSVVVLRNDEMLNKPRLRGLLRRAVFTAGYTGTHEARAHRNGLLPYFGFYEPAEFWSGDERRWPEMPQRIAFCMGSGFPSNQWPLIRWTQLGRALLAEGIDVRILRTPREQDDVAVLLRSLGLDHRATIECRSVAAMHRSLRDIDLVVASDGGGGHLCSLAAPVLTIAGSVDFRRYAPFGGNHRVVSLALPCSPCINYHPRALNGCFSHECLYGIDAQAVVAAIRCPAQPAGAVVALPPRGHLFFGVSHA
jgi:heptosyltransferase-2